MDSEPKPTPEDVEAEMKAPLISQTGQAENARHFFYLRSRIYTGLLIFVVLVGLPLIGIPKLRERLGERTRTLRLALTPNLSRPVTLKVGENQTAFPEEYAKAQAVIPILPQIAAVPLKSATPRAAVVFPPVRIKSKSDQSAEEGVSKSTEGGDATENADNSPTADETGPQFRQGRIEQEAYDVLLKANATLSEMVAGKNPSFRFKTWAAAKQEEDAFLVDLTFIKLPDNQEEHFIWQVKMLSKLVTPLSFSARSLATP